MKEQITFATMITRIELVKEIHYRTPQQLRNNKQRQKNTENTFFFPRERVCENIFEHTCYDSMAFRVCNASNLHLEKLHPPYPRGL